MSKNSEIGLMFAKREARGWDRMLLKRSPRLILDVIASRGMLILAMVEVERCNYLVR